MDASDDASATSAAEASHLVRQGGAGRLRRSVLAAAVILGIIAPASVVAAVGATSFSAAPALANGPLINGGGSSYAAVAIDQWRAEILSIDGDNVNYNTSSSVIGLNEFAQNQLDFGASEIGYSTGQASNTPTERYQYLPDVAGATCLMYNLTDITGHPITQLLLNSRLLAEMFSGQIKFWDDPQIKALNGGVLLPHTPIAVVWRTDASGDNYLFSEYLAFEQASIWNPFAKSMLYPPGADAVFPYPQQGGYPKKYDLTGWIGAQGSDIASNDVAAQNGAITYVETAYAYEHAKPCAYIENASGHYVIPTEENDAVALEGAELLPDLEQKLQGVYTNPLSDAYPISAYSYLITEEGTETPQKGAVLGQFIEFLACRGQDSAGQLGYSPLPPNLVQDDFNAVDRIAGAAKAPAKPTAANCPNPYVDGETPLPGEPGVEGSNPGGVTTPTTTTVPTGSGSKTGSKGSGHHHKKGHTSTTTVTTQPSKGGGGGVLTGPTKSSSSGIIPGYKLLQAVTGLAGHAGPSGTMLWGGLVASLIVLVLPAVLLGRRRRATPKALPARIGK
ncbi:MAG: substrate-binding domain-containing protein [Acidimicrobiales bacterium]|jgi:phosphate transport system substrate-binding protein